MFGPPPDFNLPVENPFHTWAQIIHNLMKIR